MVGLAAAPLSAHAQPQTEAVTSIAFAPPTDRQLIVDYVDDRLLADGQRAQFRQSLRIRFSLDQAGYLADVGVIAMDCDGPANLCSAYMRIAGPLRGQSARFAISPSAQVRPLGQAAQPASDDASGAAAQIGTILSAQDEQAPGAIASADLEQLLQFAGRQLPVIGSTEGQAASITGRNADGTLRIAGLVQREGLTEQREAIVDQMTGLTLSAHTSSWMGPRSGTPLRIRTMTVSPAAGPVP